MTTQTNNPTTAALLDAGIAATFSAELAERQADAQAAEALKAKLEAVASGLKGFVESVHTSAFRGISRKTLIPL